MIVPFQLGNQEMERGGEPEILSGNVIGPSVLLTSYVPRGEIHVQENWIIAIRQFLKNIRPLLHVGFFFGVTMVFFLLVGKRRAVWLSAGLALAIEASQWSFGYGFDLKDVVDLISGGAGIWLAFWSCRKIKQRFKRSDGVFGPFS